MYTNWGVKKRFKSFFLDTPFFDKYSISAFDWPLFRKIFKLQTVWILAGIQNQISVDDPEIELHADEEVNKVDVVDTVVEMDNDIGI